MSDTVLRLNVVESTEEQRIRLATIKDRIKTTFAYSPKLCQQLTELVEFGEEIVEFQHEYDFENVQGNGYRSLLRLGIKLVEFGLSKFENCETSSTFVRDFSNLVQKFLSGAEVVRTLRDATKDSGSPGSRPLQTPDEYFGAKMFFEYLKSSGNEVFYGQLCDFSHETNFMRKGSRFFITLATIFASTNISEAIRIYKDVEYRSRVYGQMVHNVDVYFVQNMDKSISSGWIGEQFGPWYVHGFEPKIRRTFRVPRQNKWIVHFDAQSGTVQTIDNSELIVTPKYFQDRVRCRFLLSPNDDGQSGSVNPVRERPVIFNCHGGGFSTSTVEGHEMYLRDWVRKLPGVAVISIDYSLAPMAKFPTQLQEGLDVYLWLISNQESVVKNLGFRPSKIVLVGDSSGACMSMALLMILNDIRKLQGGERCISLMPSGLVSVYGSFTSDPKLYPSMVMAASHWILTPAVFTSFVECYVPHELKYSTNCSHYNRKDNTFVEKLISMVNWMNPWSTFDKSTSKQVPWYWSADEEACKEYLVNGCQLLRHPYVSPLMAQNFEDFANVQLHLVASDNDPILDQSVMMAKRWKGPVTLDIVQELMHGFLFSSSLGGAYMEASDLCLNRIKEVIGNYEKFNSTSDTSSTKSELDLRTGG